METYQKSWDHYGNLLPSLKRPSKSKIKWDEVPGAEQSFLTTKELISMRPKLFFYDETAPIVLLTDASDYGIGDYTN